jgi:nitrite reductase/ring-hydroxylating ferredoxin subunit
MMGILTKQDQAVCHLDDIPARGKRTVHMGERTIVVIACDAGIYAVDASQPGMARKLAHSKVLNGILTMPNDGAQYDLSTGQCISNGAWSFPHDRLPMLPTHIEDDTLYVRGSTL